MTRTVNQSGSRFAEPMPGSVSTTNIVTSSSLSAIGSSQAPSVVFWPVEPRDQAVEQVGEAGDDERDQRPAPVAVEQQDHERRNQQHPEDGELIRGRQVHRTGSASRARASCVDRGDRFGAGHRPRQLKAAVLARWS